MPIKILDGLPAKAQLAREHIFTMEELRATKQDIRPLRVLILNLMPKKEVTEVQLLRLLGNSPLQVEVDFLHMSTHQSKNTVQSHLEKFYNTFDDIKEMRYDGMIITGAPVEKLKFEDVDYFDELKEIMEWSKHNVYSVIHICWGAQAGLYYHYGVEKTLLNEKLFGIYKAEVKLPQHELTRGFDDYFFIPQSRHTAINVDQLIEQDELLIISQCQFGPELIVKRNSRQVFILGHLEYDRLTLAEEYFRDLGKGLEINQPYQYFPHDDINARPELNWRSHANLFYHNWLNTVYQWTPYDLNKL